MNIGSVIIAGQAQEEEREKAPRKTDKDKKAHFSSQTSGESRTAEVKKEGGFFDMLFGNVGEKNALRQAGLPPELAGKSIEEALVILKDNITMAGDELADKMTDKAFNDYRKAVGHLTRFVVNNSLDIEKKQSSRNRRSRRTIYTQIGVIDKKLNELAAQIFLNQRNRFAILSKTEEIAGLIVDMLF